MIKLLKIELKKLLPYRTFRVLMGLYMVFLMMAVIGGISFQFFNFSQPANYIYGFPRIWYHASIFGSMLNTALGIIIIMVTCNEFTYRTARQHIIDGQSKGDLVAGKLLLMLTLSVFVTTVLAVGGLVSGFIYSERVYIADIFERIMFIPGFMLQAFCVMTLGYLFAILFRKTGLSVLLFLLYLVPMEFIIRKVLVKPIIGSGVEDYFPAYTFYIKICEFYVDTAIFGPVHSPSIQNVAWGLGYAVLFSLMAFGVMRKRDL